MEIENLVPLSLRESISKSIKSRQISDLQAFFFQCYAEMFKNSQYVGEQFGEQFEKEKSAHQIARSGLFMNMFTS